MCAGKDMGWTVLFTVVDFLTFGVTCPLGNQPPDTHQQLSDTIISACECVVGVAMQSLQLGLQLKYSFIKPFYAVRILQIDSDSSGILKLCNRTC